MLEISEIQINHMKTECVTDTEPRIGFALKSDIPGEELEHAVISSGEWSVTTTDQINNKYSGEMKPFHRYNIRIKAEGKSGETAQKETTFQTGRINLPWKGKWITDMQYSFPDRKSPRPMAFRKSFIAGEKIKKAWIVASALGIYEMELNGKKVGKDYFAPGFTSYEHQIQYQYYDITDMLEHKNQLYVYVAGGWAAGSFTYHRKSHISCDRQAFLCEIYLEYESGDGKIISSDENWEVTEDTPWQLAEWYDGEVYDRTFDWQMARWKKADITVPKGKPHITVQYGLPVRQQMVMKPVDIRTSQNREIIYDFGQNFAGVICAKIRNAQKGDKIVFRHAEVLSDGELFVKSLRTAKASAVYICTDGEQMYSPRFTYMGFRYVSVSGISSENIELSAYVLHSDFENIGEFSCSNEMINRLNENILWGGKSNFIDVPTDCPQRDEREGWTGDAAVFASTACYNFDMSRFYDKWLRDMASEQGKGGGIPMVIPKHGDPWPVMATACWGDSCILVPWAEYLASGECFILERQYPVMKRFLKAAKWWAGFLSVRSSKKYVWRWPFQYGDWCAPGENITQWMFKGKWIATAYFANSCGIVSQIAEILGNKDDSDFYTKLRGKIVNAYRKNFTDGKGNLKKEFQTAYVLPIYFNMAKGKEKQTMSANLNRLIVENGYKLSTGFTGTPYLLFALSDNGYIDTAYRVLLQEECPGWMYEVKAGGTTIWERWDALRADGTVNTGSLVNGKEDKNGGMVSFNHYANGAVGDWLYRRIAGIEPVSGGYRRFRIAPRPGGRLTWTRGSLKTPFGTIISEWTIKKEIFYIRVQVPVSTECTLCLPDGEEKILKSGNYEFKCKI